MSRCDDNSGRVSGHVAFGVFLLVVGVLALLNNLNIINIPPLTRLIWPALIIWVGLNMIWRGRGITGAKNDSATDSTDGGNRHWITSDSFESTARTFSMWIVSAGSSFMPKTATPPSSATVRGFPFPGRVIPASARCCKFCTLEPCPK